MIIQKISLSILSCVLLTVPIKGVIAQTPDSIKEETTIQFSPPDDGMPGNTTGGASRPTGSCLIRQGANQASNITFFAPDSFVGQTVSAHPEFLLYAEHTPVREIFVSIQNEQGESIYQGFQTLPSDTGFFTISLPTEISGLETDNIYKVSVVPICDTTLRPDDPVLTGFVKRTTLTATLEKSPQNSVLEVVQKYAASGIWYDSLVLLEQAISQSPEDVTLINAWDVLMSSGGFSDNSFDRQDF